MFRYSFYHMPLEPIILQQFFSKASYSADVFILYIKRCTKLIFYLTSVAGCTILDEPVLRLQNSEAVHLFQVSITDEQLIILRIFTG